MNAEDQTTPAAYLTIALEHIKTHALFRDRVDWPAVREQAVRLTEHAKTPADTYPAIRYVLQQLGDGHSFLVEPEVLNQGQAGRRKGFGFFTAGNTVAWVFPDSPAAHAGLLLGDVILSSARDDQGMHLQVRREQQPAPMDLTLVVAEFSSLQMPQGLLLDHRLGYIELPGISGSPDVLTQYADTAQLLICELDRSGALAWVVDLRRNTGGNMWPMLAGIGPLLGAGEVGTFVPAGGEPVPWSYRDGKSFVGTFEAASVSGPAYTLKRPGPPVAVLTSALTCSSGEAMVIAFRGGPRTRSFGERTRGLSTANDDTRLSDGAQLALTTAYEADRMGQVYTEGIPVDEPVSVHWARFGTEMDPVLRTASTWLQNELSRV